jgi:hypothetical protein
MNALELLVHLTNRQIDSVFRAARALPADKLDWKPAPGARSALDQLQEIATASDRFFAIYTERKMEWSDEKFAEWMAERQQITSIDELERICKEQTKRLTDYILTVPESELTAPVELPFPGPFNMADVLSYQYWNASYHEGQINYIATLLEA